MLTVLSLQIPPILGKITGVHFISRPGGMVDTPDSKSCERKLVTVQVRPAAPKINTQSKDWVFIFVLTTGT